VLQATFVVDEVSSIIKEVIFKLCWWTAFHYQHIRLFPCLRSIILL